MGGAYNASPASNIPDMRHLARLVKALPTIFRQASHEWVNDNAPRLGASLTFYTLLSLAPILVIAVAVGAAVYGQQAAQGRLDSEIRGLIGSDAALTIQDFVARAYQPRSGVVATVLSLITLAFGATSVFLELRDAMNTIWHVARTPDRSHAATLIRLVRERFYSFATVLGTGLLLLASLVMTAWIGAMKISVPQAATFLMSYLAVVVVFATLYKVLPDVDLDWSDVAPGAIIGALLFMLGNFLMGLYFANASLASVYDAAGSPIVAMLWIYYSAQILFWGAEFSKVCTTSVGSRRLGKP